MERTLLVVLFLTCTAIAQPGPGRDGPGREGPGREGPVRDKPGGEFTGPGGQRGPGQGGLQNPLIAQIDMMRSWLELVDRYVRLSKDPVSSGVAAVISADDLMRNKQPSEAIDYFTRVLPEVKNETIQRAIRLQLIDLYGKNRQPEKALEEMKKLMTDVPARPSESPGRD